MMNGPLKRGGSAAVLAALQVYINGEFRPGNEATVSVWDHGFLYGDGIFEGLRCYGGKVFKLEAHLDRLYYSAKVMAMEMPLERAEMRRVILETVRRNGLRDAHIRPMISRGMGSPGVGTTNFQPTVVVFAHGKLPPARNPLRCLISTVRRKSPLSVDTRIKSLNYLDSKLAFIQARAAGYDDAVMLDHNGCIAETTSANLFVVRQGRLMTPTTMACLDGITRGVVLEISDRMSIPAVDTNLPPGDLYAADEAFVCSTSKEIVPIGEVDGRRIGSGEMGEITGRIAAEFDRIKLTEDVVDAYASAR